MGAAVLIYSRLFMSPGICANVKFDIWLVYTQNENCMLFMQTSEPVDFSMFLFNCCIHVVTQALCTCFYGAQRGSLLAPHVGPDHGLSPRLRQLMRTFDWTLHIGNETWPQLCGFAIRLSQTHIHINGTPAGEFLFNARLYVGNYFLTAAIWFSIPDI